MSLARIAVRNPNPSLPVALEHEERIKRFGGNVRRERTLRGISQAKLASEAALNVRTIAKIEAGELKVRKETVSRLCKAIGCPAEHLLHGCE